MTDRAQRPTTLRRARRALVLIGLVIPILMTALAVALIVAWLPELPDPAAVHWGPGGVDGFGPPVIYVWLAIGLGAVLPALMAAPPLIVARKRWGSSARILGAQALGFSGFGLVMATGLTHIQRGLADAAQAPGVWPVLALAIGAMVLLAVVGWMLQPEAVAEPSEQQAAPVRRVEAGERVVWMSTGSLSRGVQLFFAVVILAMTALVVWGALGIVAALIGGLIAPFVVVLADAVSACRVRVGPGGLLVRSRLGVPRIQVPLSDITAVRVIDCSPLGEFGGYGWRISLDGRRVGAVLRAGPALEVDRADGRTVVVTVADAAVGAGVLQAYREQRDPMRGRERP